MKKVVVLQSNYIPWKGYFDLMNMADEFIILDDVQYTRSDWRNRNLIKAPEGLRYLTIPVAIKGKLGQAIDEVSISDRTWSRRHWYTISHCYSKAAFFRQYKEYFEDLYLSLRTRNLSEINYIFLNAVRDLLGIKTRLTYSKEYDSVDGRTERVLSLCKSAGADEYISGPSAREYLNLSLFAQENILVTWMDYSDYPAYSQLYPPFQHGVSILDLIFNEGPRATSFMKSFSGVSQHEG